MNPVEKYAFDAAKEITIAKLSNSTSMACKTSGAETADYFEAVYSRLLSLTKSNN